MALPGNVYDFVLYDTDYEELILWNHAVVTRPDVPEYIKVTPLGTFGHLWAPLGTLGHL